MPVKELDDFHKANLLGRSDEPIAAPTTAGSCDQSRVSQHQQDFRKVVGGNCCFLRELPAQQERARRHRSKVH